jgi:hypothetical protein
MKVSSHCCLMVYLMKLDLIGGMVSNGWPSDKSIYEFAAYEILKFGTENKGKYQEGVSNFE